MLYDETFTVITSKLSEASKVQKIAKVGGWVAAILTGGIGLEDAIIVPLVNKALLSILGINLQKSIDLIDYCLSKIIVCLREIKKNEAKDFNMILNYFLILIKIRIREGDKSAITDVLNLVNPFSKDETIINLSCKLNKSEIEEQLFQVLTSNIEFRDEINLLLLEILHKYKETDNKIFKKLKKMYTNQNQSYQPHNEYIDLAKAKEILGIPSKEKVITKTELTKYRNNKIREYHPDKYCNHPSEFMELAKRKTIEINLAYEFLLKYI